MRRELPLFIIDTTRRHKLGEVDFISCTDKDNGFIAKVEFIPNCPDEFGEDFRVVKGGHGISARISIVRYTGGNPSKTAIRSLLKQCSVRYMELMETKVDVGDPSDEQCINFLDALIRGNRHNVDAAGSNYEERKVVLTSLAMLEAIKRKLLER